PPDIPSFPTRRSSDLWTRLAVHELEHDAAEITFCQRAALARVHRVGLDEFDAAPLELSNRRRHVGCADADALEMLFPLDVGCRRFRFDKLQIKATTRALEKQSLRQDSEANTIGQGREAEQPRVE